MTKALLVARGGFIPDENRILRPADRPGRPPFLRPVGADQSRDEVRAASGERLSKGIRQVNGNAERLRRAEKHL